MQLYENEALKELLITLDKESKYQLKELIKTYESFEYKTPSEFLRFLNLEKSIREIMRESPEFFCRGKVKNYSFTNCYVEEVKSEAAKMGYSLKRKIYQLNSYSDGARRNRETTCWLLESADGKIEFYEDEKSEGVKILFFATSGCGGFFKLKRLITAARKLLLIQDKKFIYGTVLEQEGEEYPFYSKYRLERALALKNDGLSRLHHLYLRLGAETIGPQMISCQRG